MRPTVQDIARRANVDVNDVIRVMLQQQGIDRKVRNHIIDAMHELNFPLTPHPTSSQQQTLGIITPDIAHTEYVGAVVTGITSVTRAARIGMKINMQSLRVREDLPQFLSDPQIFGVLLVSPDYYEDTFSVCRHYRVPIATMGYREGVDLSEILVLQTNNRQSIINAVDYLTGLHHQRIGFITGNMANGDALERFEGYRAGLAKHGIVYDRTLVSYGDFDHDSGYAGGLALLQQNPRPTAIIASNDLMALGAIDAANSLNLQIGTDYSIVGFDDIPTASQIPFGLTTMAQPYEAMAAAAVEGLQKMARGEKLADYRLRFEARFIIRGSTIAAP